jgi:Rrf2 family protein
MKATTMRLQLTRRTDYAIRACLHLTSAEACPVSGRRIAEQAAIPGSFLPQVMADLGRAGIVAATNGKHGGYCLRRDPAALSLLEVVEAVEGTDRRRGCALRDSPCEDDPGCALHHVWARAQTAFVDVLAGASIGEMATRQRAVLETNGRERPERTDR